MRCEAVCKLLDAYAEGTLDGTKAHLLAEHLRQCSKCQKQWQETQILLRLLSDAFTDFTPLPSPNLERKIEQKITTQRSSVRRQVVALRSQAIFAIAAVALIWFVANFMNQPFVSQPNHVREFETETKIEKGKKPMSSTQQLRKPEQQSEKIAISTVKRHIAKQRTILVRKANVKVATRKEFRMPKAIAQSGEVKTQSREQVSPSHELPVETLPKFINQPKMVLVCVERTVSVNPVEPVSEIFVYRSLSSPEIQEVAAPLSQFENVQTVALVEILTSSLMRP